jgi:hypothetical protein
LGIIRFPNVITLLHDIVLTKRSIALKIIPRLEIRNIKRREVHKARMSCAVSPPKKPSLEPKPSKLDRRVLTPPHDTHLTHTI